MAADDKRLPIREDAHAIINGPARPPEFLPKLGAAAALVALADVLFFVEEVGWTLGLFALAWVAALTATVLALASAVDLGAIAAWWNVRHAREVDGAGAALDLCYLRQLWSHALLPLRELERGLFWPELRDRVAAVRADLHADLARDVSDWRGWSWREGRRLRAAGPPPRGATRPGRAGPATAWPATIRR